MKVDALSAIHLRSTSSVMKVGSSVAYDRMVIHSA